MRCESLETLPDTPVTIRRAEGAQVKWCWEPQCSLRVRPECQGTFGVASRVPSSVSHFKTERGTSLEMLQRARASSCNDEGPHGFSRVAEGFSSYDREFRLPLMLAQGSTIFHSSFEGELWIVLESLQIKRDLI